METKYGLWKGKPTEELDKEELLQVIAELGRYYESRIKELDEIIKLYDK